MKVMKTIESKSMGITDIFEVVEKIPTGFFVWNIGRNMGYDDYIPFCEDLHPEDKSNYEINRNTLKAVKLDVEEVKILRDAANYGVNNFQSAEKALKSKRKGLVADKKRKFATKTIEIFRKITLAEDAH